MLEFWERTQPMYMVNQTSNGPSQPWLQCTSIRREFTGDITACHGADVLLDTARTHSASCLRWRPGSRCDRGPAGRLHFVLFDDDAFQPMSQQGAACSVTRTRHFSPSLFDPEYNKVIMAAFPGGFFVPAAPGGTDGVQCKPADPADLTLLVPGRTMFVPRMYKEHTNIYQAITDMFHAYMQAISFGWSAEAGDGDGYGPHCMAPTGRPSSTCTLSLVVEDIRILFVDEFLERPLEQMWEDLFTRPLYPHTPPSPPRAGAALTARTWCREMPSDPHLRLPPHARCLSEFGLPLWTSYISAQRDLSSHLAAWQTQRETSTRRGGGGGGERDVLFPVAVAVQQQQQQQQQQLLQSLQDASTGVYEVQDAPTLIARAAKLSSDTFPGAEETAVRAPKLLFEEWGLSSPTFTSIFHGTTRTKIAHSGEELPYWGTGSSSSTVYSDAETNTKVPGTASESSYWDLLHAALPPGQAPTVRLLREGAADGGGSGGSGSGVAAGPHHMMISPEQQYWTVNSGRSTILM